MGWMKLHKDLLNWEWHDIPEMMTLWIHLLLSANHEDKTWRGIEVPKGAVITSHAELSKMSGISVKQVRTCLSRLEKTGEILIERASKYSIVTICKYETYQDVNSEEGKQEGSQGASKGQAEGSQRATPKELENNRLTKETISNEISKKVEDLKTEAKKTSCAKIEYATRVHLTEKEFATLVSKYGEEDTRWMIDKLSAYKVSKNKSYSSDYGAINSWVTDRLAEEKLKVNKQQPQTNYSNDKYW